ncbi:TetR/AcrR family transcriptional regulator [candidate division KSB1 bacterium]|nr:TetR/AcrR family transcriptional regulator [candidate division KSB1 bacterium]
MDASKRERILKAAVKVFARSGFYNSKMGEIAQKAGVAVGTTYLYFEDKDDLMISIFEEEMVPLIKKMKEAMDARITAAEKIHAFISTHLSFVQNEPDMAQLLEVEMRQCSKFIHGYDGTRFKEYLDLVSDALVEGQKNGEFRPDVHATIFKQMVFGAVDQIATNYTISKTKRIKLTESAEQISKIILHGIHNR